MAADHRILVVNEVATLHMGPSHVIVTLSLDFVDGIDSSEVERAVTELNAAATASCARANAIARAARCTRRSGRATTSAACRGTTDALGTPAVARLRAVGLR